MTGRPPSCYGKLPARADFVHRRLPRATVEQWDGWLQACICHSRAALGEAWQDLFLVAPPWRLALPGGACGRAALAGVVVPSVDAVGRCFPLLIAEEIGAAADAQTVALDGERWFEAAEALALDALSPGFDLRALERPLPPILGRPSAERSKCSAQEMAGCWTRPADLRASLARPLDSRSALWWTGGGGTFSPALAVTEGLVAPERFPALLDGQAEIHGWNAWPGPVRSLDAGLDWDREE